MKNWNIAARIKTIVLIIAGITNGYMPFKPLDQSDIASAFIFPSISAIILPSLMVLIRASTYTNMSKPKWNDNPFTNRLAFAQFFAYLFIVAGFAMIIGSLIKIQIFNSVGFIAFSFGIGILLSILLALYISRKSVNKVKG